MKQTKLLFFTLIMPFLIFSCKPTETIQTQKEATSEQLSYYQNSQEKLIPKEVNLIHIDKKKFALRFLNKKEDFSSPYYAIQIAAFKDKATFDEIKVGSDINDIVYFEPGSGMAPDATGKYESLIFETVGHHYLFYDNSENKRLNLIEEQEKFIKFEFEINGFYFYKNSKEVTIPDSVISQFYLAILIDKNNNNIIDENELKKLTVKFK